MSVTARSRSGPIGAFSTSASIVRTRRKPSLARRRKAVIPLSITRKSPPDARARAYNDGGGGGPQDRGPKPPTTGKTDDAVAHGPTRFLLLGGRAFAAAKHQDEGAAARAAARGELLGARRVRAILTQGDRMSGGSGKRVDGRGD